MSEPTDYAKLLQQMEHWKAFNCKAPSEYRARGEFWTLLLFTHFPAAAKEVMGLRAEVQRLRQQIAGHVERIAAQSELLSRRAEKE